MRWPLLLLLPSLAQAGNLRRPFAPAVAVRYGFDNNGGGAGCTDYNCGGDCYDTHTGSDFPVGLGTAVLAADAGRVTQVNDGCANYGYYGNTCGGRCGNYVRIQHDDGMNYCFRTCVDKPDCNENRDAENESNCSSSVTFVDGANGRKACVPPSST